MDLYDYRHFVECYHLVPRSPTNRSRSILINGILIIPMSVDHIVRNHINTLLHIIYLCKVKYLLEMKIIQFSDGEIIKEEYY